MQLSFRRKAPNAVGPLGLWAFGPLGLWAFGPLGRWAVGPLGRWAVGPLGRWAVGPLGRWAVGPLMIGALYATHSVAQAQESTKLAGTWFKYYQSAGTGTASSAQGRFVYKFADRAYDGKTPDPNYGDVHVRNNYPNDASITADSNSGAASAELSDVSIKVIYEWIPEFYYGYGLGPYPQGMQLEDPDPKLNFLVRSYAGATAGSQGATSASANGKDAVSNADKNSSVQSKRLYSFDTKGQTKFSAVIPFSAKATLPAGDHMYGSASVAFDAYADIDSRSLSLSRGGAAGDTLDDDGTTMHGDTTYSYLRSITTVRPDASPAQILEKNWQTIAASFGGTWQSYDQAEGLESYGTSYTWTPAGTHPFYTDSSQRSMQLMPQGQLSMDVNGNWQGTSGADSYTDLPITYEITDSDGAVAKAVYKLRVHNPVELKDTDNWEVHYLTEYISPIDGSRPSVDYPNAIGGNYQMTNSKSSGWSASSTIGTDFELFKVPLGWDVSASYEESTEQGETESSPTPLNPDGTPVVLKLGETVHLRVKHKFQRYYASFWRYNEAGKIKRYSSGQSGESIEVPHEAIWDRWLDNQFVWSNPYRLQDGRPEIDPSERQLPDKQPSYHYSLKEDQNAKPLV